MQAFKLRLPGHRMPFGAALVASLILFLPAIPAFAQSAQETTTGAEAQASAAVPVVPQQVRYAGKLTTRAGDIVEAVFRIYSAAEGGEPLWTETQHIAVADDGSYTALLGSATPSGLPQAVFAGGAARWLGVSVERGPEQDRTLLSSVPYAMKSADAESLAGHAVSDFVTRDQLAALAAQPTQPTAPPRGALPETGGTVTGSGTTNTLPLWTSSSTIGNSAITQSGTSIGINIAAPASTLDVDGGVTVRGNLNLPAPAKATAAKGEPSNLFEFSSSAWSSSAKAAQGETFFMVADPTGNNTASPSATLNFQFKNGSAAPATVFSVAGNGIMTFSPAQTFPGTISSVAGAGPITATVHSGVATVGLNTSTLETTLNAFYAQLAQPNTFSSYLSATTNKGIEYAAVSGAGYNGSIGVLGTSDTGYGVYAETESSQAVFGQATAPTYASAGVEGSVGTSLSQTATAQLGNLTAGVVADASCCTSQSLAMAGLLASSDSGYGAIVANNSSTTSALFVTNASGAAVTLQAVNGDGLDGTTYGGGIGLSGTSTNTAGIGVKGSTSNPGKGDAGVLGVAASPSSTFGTLTMYAGLWGDTGTDNTTLPVGTAANGVTGTADQGRAGLFMNNSAQFPTMYVLNLNPDGVNGLFKTFMASSSDGACGIGSGGSLSCTGQIKSLVSSGGGAHTVETYAPQSAENWMEDYGTGSMERGVAIVRIDPEFAATTSESADYHVFLTPRADSKGLYVINATPTSFEVRESGGGTSSLSFDYKIVARRRGYEKQRLVDVTERLKDEQKRATITRVPHPASGSTLSPHAIPAHPRNKTPLTAPVPSALRTHPAAASAAIAVSQ